VVFAEAYERGTGWASRLCFGLLGMGAVASYLAPLGLDVEGPTRQVPRYLRLLNLYAREPILIGRQRNKERQAEGESP
jgi:hypothetical protein